MEAPAASLTRRVGRGVFAVLAGLAVLAPSLPAAAAKGPTAAEKAAEKAAREQRKREIQQQITSLKGQVEEASAEETALLDRLDEVQSRRQALDDQVADLDRQLRAVQADVDAAEARLTELQGRFVKAQTQLRIADGQVAEARIELKDRAVAAYIGSPAASAASVMLRANTMRKLAATLGYLETVVQVQKAALDRYSSLRDGVEELRSQVEATKDQARAQRDVIIARQARVEAVRAEQAGVLAQVAGDEAEQAALLGQVRDQKDAFEEQIAGLRAESQSITALLRGVQTVPAVAAGKGILSAPIPGARITSRFGPRVHPILGTVRMHEGLDLASPSGAPIAASGDGVVIIAGWRGGYGNATIIDHGNGLATLYGHQSRLDVVAGERVTRGQVIGAVGSTGFSTGPHLHFEVRAGGTPVDPLLYL